MTSAYSTIRARAAALPGKTPGQALIIVGLVACIGMLAVYGHLVQKQVERGENLRAAQRAGLYTVREGSLLRPKLALNAVSGQLLAGASPR